MIFHFPNSPLCHRRYVVCGHNKSICDGMSNYDQSIYVQANLYISTLNPVSNLKFLSKVIAAIYAYEGLFVW